MTEVVTIVGQGYVGLPLARAACAAGLSVWGLDTSRPVVNSLNAGRSHIDDVRDDDVAVMLTQGYRATTDSECVSESDVVVVCVPTPLGEGGGPDLTAVVGAMQVVASRLRRGTLVVLESTTYPGTTEDVCLPLLSQSGLVLDKDFMLAFSPERVDPGRRDYGIRNTPKLVGGVTSASGVAAVEFYSRFVETVVPLRGAREAETAKLLENTFRHVNIALVNEMAKFCHELQIDIWDVIRGAATKPFGFMAFTPGPGVGGHCIPIDPNYLSYEVRKKLGYPFRFVELAQEINNSMPRYVVERAADLLNERERSLKGSRVLLVGVTYKADISDLRESPAIAVAEAFLSKGSLVSYHDPFVPELRFSDRSLVCVDDFSDALRSADLTVLLQPHSGYDLQAIEREAYLLFDTRGVTGVSSRL